MKKKISTILLFLFLFFCVNIFSQQVIDLQTCIEKGLENNFEIKIVRNNQKISDNNYSVGNAGMLPSLNLNATHSGSLNDVTKYPNGEAVFTPGVNNSGIDLGVSLNWTIFDGFRMFANYDKLKELHQKGELDTRLTVENFVADISAEYYNFVQQSIRLNNLKSAVRLSRERLRIVEAQRISGSKSGLDLLQARVDFNADSSKLIRQQELLFASRVRLNKLMATDNLEQQQVPADTSIVFNALLQKENLWKDVLQNNTLLLLSANAANISMKDLQLAQSKNYPYIRVSAGYGYTSRNELSARQQNTLGMNYNVTLGFNIFDGFNRVREQRNIKLQIENGKFEDEKLRIALQSDFANIWNAYRNNLELVALEQENLNAATENYSIAIYRYKLGDLAGIELREAQNSLLEAGERLVQAQYNTKLCEISLLQISGQLSIDN